MAYTNATLISNSLKRALTANETALLVMLIPAVQRYIDRVLDSTFDTADVTSRLYDVCDSSVIDIEPCQSITAIAYIDRDGISSNDYIASEYVLEPQNETIKRWVHMRHKIRAYTQLANIKVTAKFTEYDFAGSKVPEDIQLVATQIVADLVDLIAGSEANIKSESIEGHTVTYGNAVDNIDRAVQNSPLVQGILNSRKQLWVA